MVMVLAHLGVKSDLTMALRWRWHFPAISKLSFASSDSIGRLSCGLFLLAAPATEQRKSLLCFLLTDKIVRMWPWFVVEPKSDLIYLLRARKCHWEGCVASGHSLLFWTIQNQGTRSSGHLHYPVNPLKRWHQSVSPGRCDQC